MFDICWWPNICRAEDKKRRSWDHGSKRKNSRNETTASAHLNTRLASPALHCGVNKNTIFIWTKGLDGGACSGEAGVTWSSSSLVIWSQKTRDVWDESVMSLLILCCSRLSELQTVTGRVVSKNIIQHKDFTLQQTNLSGTNSLGSDGSRCENTFRLRGAIRSCVSSKRHTDNTTPPTNSLRHVWSSGCFRQLPLCREAEQRRCSITWRLIFNQGKTLKACL